jgi:hypothetical protein
MRPSAHIHPVPKLRMNGAVSPFPPYAFIAFVLKTLPCLPRLFVTYFLYRSAFRLLRSSFSRRLCLKCDGTCAETRFHLSPKRTSPFKSAGASVQSTAGSRGVRIGGSNAGYTTFRGSVKSTGYPLHSPVSPSLPLPCVTLCHHISTGLYYHLNLNISVFSSHSSCACCQSHRTFLDLMVVTGGKKQIVSV